MLTRSSLSLCDLSKLSRLKSESYLLILIIFLCIKFYTVRYQCFRFPKPAPELSTKKKCNIQSVYSVYSFFIFQSAELENEQRRRLEVAAREALNNNSEETIRKNKLNQKKQQVCEPLLINMSRSELWHQIHCMIIARAGRVKCSLSPGTPSTGKHIT